MTKSNHLGAEYLMGLAGKISSSDCSTSKMVRLSRLLNGEFGGLDSVLLTPLMSIVICWPKSSHDGGCGSGEQLAAMGTRAPKRMNLAASSINGDGEVGCVVLRCDTNGRISAPNELMLDGDVCCGYERAG